MTEAQTAAAMEDGAGLKTAAASPPPAAASAPSAAGLLPALEPLLSLPLVDVAGTERFIARVMKEDTGEVFTRPVRVTPDIADYPQRIARPMDLSTLRARFRSGAYAEYGQLLRDLELVWQNCIDYNGEEHYLAVKAAALRLKARQHLLRAIEQWQRRDEFTGQAAKRCRQLLERLSKGYGQPFTVKLESTDIWDEYSSRVATPLDLSTIAERITSGHYQRVQQFESDVRLVFLNCIAYWGPATRYAISARFLLNEFELSMKEIHFALTTGTAADGSAAAAVAAGSKGGKKGGSKSHHHKHVIAAAWSPALHQTAAPGSGRDLPLTPLTPATPGPTPPALLQQPSIDSAAACMSPAELHKCADIVKALHADAAYHLFARPADIPSLWDSLSDYYVRVQRPMDLQTLMRRLAVRDFSTSDEFRQDVALIWRNVALYYTGEGSSGNLVPEEVELLRTTARRLEEDFSRRWETFDAAPSAAGSSSSGSTKQRATDGGSNNAAALSITPAAAALDSASASASTPSPAASVTDERRLQSEAASAAPPAASLLPSPSAAVPAAAAPRVEDGSRQAEDKQETRKIRISIPKKLLTEPLTAQTVRDAAAAPLPPSASTSAAHSAAAASRLSSAPPAPPSVSPQQSDARSAVSAVSASAGPSSAVVPAAVQASAASEPLGAADFGILPPPPRSRQRGSLLLKPLTAAQRLRLTADTRSRLPLTASIADTQHSSASLTTSAVPAAAQARIRKRKAQQPAAVHAAHRLSLFFNSAAIASRLPHLLLHCSSPPPSAAFHASPFSSRSARPCRVMLPVPAPVLPPADSQLAALYAAVGFRPAQSSGDGDGDGDGLLLRCRHRLVPATAFFPFHLDAFTVDAAWSTQLPHSRTAFSLQVELSDRVGSEAEELAGSTVGLLEDAAARLLSSKRRRMEEEEEEAERCEAGGQRGAELRRGSEAASLSSLLLRAAFRPVTGLDRTRLRALPSRLSAFCSAAGRGSAATLSSALLDSWRDDAAPPAAYSRIAALADELRCEREGALLWTHRLQQQTAADSGSSSSSSSATGCRVLPSDRSAFLRLCPPPVSAQQQRQPATARRLSFVRVELIAFAGTAVVQLLKTA